MPATFLGVDVSARHGFAVAQLDEGLALLRLEILAEPEQVVELARGMAGSGPSFGRVAVDAPQTPRLDKTAKDRCCDAILRRAGIGIYKVPTEGEKVAAWMQVGFDLFKALRDGGLRLPCSPEDSSASLLEVYPYATFVLLAKEPLPSKTSAAGLNERLRLLRSWGIALGPAGGGLSHDAADALAAAYTAYLYKQGRCLLVGDPMEGLMTLPQSGVKEERLKRLEAIICARRAWASASATSNPAPWCAAPTTPANRWGRSWHLLTM